MNTSQKLTALFEAGWTQIAVSQETGVPQGTLSRIASGKHNDPRASNAYAIDRLYEREIEQKKDAA